MEGRLMGRRIEDMDRPALVALIMDHYASRNLETQRRLNRELRLKKIEQLKEILRNIRDKKLLPESFA